MEDRRHGNQPPELAKDENPLVFSMGRYELEQMKKVREEAHRDLAKFYEEQVYYNMTSKTLKGFLCESVLIKKKAEKISSPIKLNLLFKISFMSVRFKTRTSRSVQLLITAGIT